MMAAKQGHVQANAELGTLCRFGRGVERDIVMAAQLHVMAAKTGDVVSLGNLSDYRTELEQVALGRNTSASLSLATIYDMGLGVGQDAATALAWTRWARAHYTPEVDEHVLLELEKLEFESVIMGSPEVELRAEALLGEMRRSRGVVRST
jgi:TPR repeat protein